ncbi:MAG: integrase domain-containing protein [Burkholderiales bacterium]
MADLGRIGAQIGGAHLTREARDLSFRCFADAMRAAGFGIRSADQIGGRHLKAFVAARLRDEIGARTLANQMSHLRAVLEHTGKSGLARNPEYSNRALGIGQGSRIGTKAPLSDQSLSAFRERMADAGRPGVGITLALQRALGLRETETIRGGRPDTLARWERELMQRGMVHVVEGTKGGRPRDTHVVDIERAVNVVREAREQLKEQGGGYLIRRADGTPAANLKQARNIYRNICHREGVQSHAARYAFARERLEGYEHAGFSQREARAATAQDLGHGDGRGRYIASVYAQVAK